MLYRRYIELITNPASLFNIALYIIHQNNMHEINNAVVWSRDAR